MDLKELVDLAATRLKEHGLSDWSFRLAKTKRRLGACKHRQKRIEIAAYYASQNPPESVTDTLLHEIAHAIAGPAAGHGPVWKAVAARLGATPKACDTSPDTIVEPGDWQTTCPACLKTHHRYRRPPTLTGYRCRCPARALLTYEYKGTIPLAQPVPTMRVANWQAHSSGCGRIHLRIRRPKSCLWRCGCPKRGDLTWNYVRVD